MDDAELRQNLDEIKSQLCKGKGRERMLELLEGR